MQEIPCGLDFSRLSHCRKCRALEVTIYRHFERLKLRHKVRDNDARNPAGVRLLEESFVH